VRAVVNVGSWHVVDTQHCLNANRVLGTWVSIPVPKPDQDTNNPITYFSANSFPHSRAVVQVYSALHSTKLPFEIICMLRLRLYSENTLRQPDLTRLPRAVELQAHTFRLTTLNFRRLPLSSTTEPLFSSPHQFLTLALSTSNLLQSSQAIRSFHSTAARHPEPARQNAASCRPAHALWPLQRRVCKQCDSETNGKVG